MSTPPELLPFGIIAEGLDIFWYRARAAYHYHLSTTATTTLFNYYTFLPFEYFLFPPDRMLYRRRILGSTGGLWRGF